MLSQHMIIDVIIRGRFGLCVSPVLEEILDGGEQEGEEVRQRERHQHEAEVDQHLGPQRNWDKLGDC